MREDVCNHPKENMLQCWEWPLEKAMQVISECRFSMLNGITLQVIYYLYYPILRRRVPFRQGARSLPIPLFRDVQLSVAQCVRHLR